VVINETMARAFFGKDDPIGRRIGYDEDATMEIVGVVKDAKVDGLRAPAPRMIYHSAAQHRDEPVRHLFVRVSGEPAAARQSVIQAIQRAEPRLAVREVVTLDEMAGRTVANERLVSNLTAGFGALAVLVACIGLFGTISYSVTRRTSEIGVRMALGASPGSIMAHIIRETAWMVLAGTAVGIVVIVAAMGFISTLLFGLSPRDPLTLAAASVTLIAVGLFAGLIPAFRASRIDPLRALRLE
jgi:predicted lysophospholipase L1 biosynthesis ABC-type transport system permease subunit